MSKVKESAITGACRFCGQTRQVAGCESQEQADELATKQCRCEDSLQIGKRDQTLRDAREDIEDLFGDAAGERGELTVPKELRDYLYNLSVYAYDQELRSIDITITQGFKAKISVTDKGKLTIQRYDSSVRKREHT